MMEVSVRIPTLAVAQRFHIPLSPTILMLLWTLALSSGYAHAATSCSGVLTDAQQQGFMALFDPPFSPGLVLIGSPVSPDNMFKQLSPTDLQNLSAAQPTTAVEVTLNDQQASDLKGWLNDDATSQIPGWVSTAIGVLVPQAWVGLSADVFIQLVNGSGDNGRLTAANIAGTVSAGGTVGVIEQVSQVNGTNKFVWAYVYVATLNGKIISMPLATCSADIASQ
jgi:hypothetical protein